MSKELSFQLNGREVTVPEGFTVMEAAQQEGVMIPHFCWHPGLKIAGVCRFCLVHVEGARKLEIACNLQVRAGMVVRTDLGEVKEAHEKALEFHLINHPLDCPICDQAGECELQNNYMQVGRYESRMTRPKVLKPKAIDLGSELVLDTERCILCSRCVRFEEEVTKTDALGIFDRGDRSIIGTYGEEKIEHNYQENLVDICPVGAFTSKRFRFKQRVWFLKEKKSVCPGCSTGCSISVHAKPETRQFFRVKPEFNQKVNGHWMCDKGRQTVEHLNQQHRLNAAWIEQSKELASVSLGEAVKDLADHLKQTKAEDIALLVSAQYTNEEYEALFNFFCGELKVSSVYQWRSPTEDRESFDKILFRGDHNANTQGLISALKKQGLSTQVKAEVDECCQKNPKVLIALAPEIPWTMPELDEQFKKLAKLSYVSLWTLHYGACQIQGFKNLLPMKGFAEKKGHFTNHKGDLGELKESFPAAVDEAFCVSEITTRLLDCL